MVEERSECTEAGSVRTGGAFRSENAGTSSKIPMKVRDAENPSSSRATRIVPGLVDPKARPKGVTDGRAD